MTSMACLSSTLRTLFTTTADTLARESGFVKRRRKLTGSAFAQTLVFGFLGCPTATLRQLQHTAALAGVAVSSQAISQRCATAAADFLQALLEAAVQTLVVGDAVALPLLQRFAAVLVLDSTTITLPAVLRTVWRGCGGSTATAAAAVLKVQGRLDLCRGGLDFLELTDGTTSDQRAASQTAPLPAGALRLSDQGFFAAAVFRTVVAAGGHFLIRPVPRLTVQVGDAPRRSLGRVLAGCRAEVLDTPVVAGGKEPLACRLIAVRVPDRVAEQRRAQEQHDAQREGRAPRPAVLALSRWTILLTSLPAEALSVAEALVLLRLRWQIELLFKRWKSAGGQVEAWRTADPWQALCTVYAKLLGCVVAHWLAAVRCWAIPDKSLHALDQAIRSHAPMLVRTLARGAAALGRELRLLTAHLCRTGRLQKRRRRPAAFQLVLAPTLQPLN